uniref:Uncharacterized protein n=1 Tax=Oryza brachyantha TaxID=4533 RepID=J3KUJ7_ORYBR
LSEESIEDSERYKRLREKNVHDHNMGPAGYDGKIAQWEAEDSLLTSEGIENPWQQYPDDRCRNFLRGRSKLEVVDGVAQIRWSKRATKKVSEDIKEKYASAKSSGVSWDFKVMVNPLGEDALDNIREKLSSFLLAQVIDKKGEFH